jgi:hypothetical protein
MGWEAGRPVPRAAAIRPLQNFLSTMAACRRKIQLINCTTVVCFNKRVRPRFTGEIFGRCGGGRNADYVRNRRNRRDIKGSAGSV